MWTNDFNETHARALIDEAIPQPTSLDTHVAEWLLDDASYDDGLAFDVMAGRLRDLQYGGCVSGMVGHLIYYSDIADFWLTYGADCAQLLSETAADCGVSIADMFREDSWDREDPLALDYVNRGLIAWAAFEETAYRIGLALGIEL